MALSAQRVTSLRSIQSKRPATFGVAGSTTLYQGGIIVRNASGYAAPGSTATGLKALGIAPKTITNTGANGAVNTEVITPVEALLANSAGGDEITVADVGANCYIVDDYTVAKTDDGGNRSACGVVTGVESAGVWVRIDYRDAL